MRKSNYRMERPNVFYVEQAQHVCGPDDIDFLKDAAFSSPDRRSRLCLHSDRTAVHQQMLIAVHKTSYIRPHYHVGKDETYHFVEGTGLIVTFAESGTPKDFFKVGPAEDQRAFSFRVAQETTHSFHIESDWLIFWEVTQGPFDMDKTHYPSWSPNADDLDGIASLNKTIIASAKSASVL